MEITVNIIAQIQLKRDMLNILEQSFIISNFVLTVKSNFMHNDIKIPLQGRTIVLHNENNLFILHTCCNLIYYVAGVMLSTVLAKNVKCLCNGVYSRINAE